MTDHSATPVANLSDTPCRYSNLTQRTLNRFWFGACGVQYVYAWGSLEDGLEAAAEWLQENGKVGFFSPPDYEAAAAELGETVNMADGEWPSEAVQQLAETDHTYTEAGYLLSWEWGCDEIEIGSPEYGDTLTRCNLELSFQ